MAEELENVSLEHLRDWLVDKPPSWAVAFAARAALRVNPVAGHLVLYGESRSDRWRTQLLIQVFRANAVAWLIAQTEFGVKIDDTSITADADAANARTDAVAAHAAKASAHAAARFCRR